MARDKLLDNARLVSRVLVITFVLNETVALAKLGWGYASGSVGMVSDGFHSMFDGLTNLVGLLGVRLAAAPPDREHPYGHRKIETLLTVVVAFMIFGTCFEILHRVYESLAGGTRLVVTATSFAVMVFSSAVNIFVMTYEARRGRELGSAFLTVDAMHTRSDLLASLGVLVGLVFGKLGYPMADALAGVVVAFLIARIGLGILRDAANVLMDGTCIKPEEIGAVVRGVEEVLGYHDIRTRGPATQASVDLHIQLDPEMPLSRAHAVTHKVQARIREAFPAVVDIVVHTEPHKG